MIGFIELRGRMFASEAFPVDSDFGVVMMRISGPDGGFGELTGLFIIHVVRIAAVLTKQRMCFKLCNY